MWARQISRIGAVGPICDSFLESSNTGTGIVAFKASQMTKHDRTACQNSMSEQHDRRLKLQHALLVYADLMKLTTMNVKSCRQPELLPSSAQMLDDYTGP